MFNNNNNFIKQLTGKVKTTWDPPVANKLIEADSRKAKRKEEGNKNINP